MKASYIRVGKSVSAENINYEELKDYNTSIIISNPHFWNGVDDPYLYTSKVILISDDGEALDEVSEKYGVRTYRIDREKGFFLNGGN